MNLHTSNMSSHANVDNSDEKKKNMGSEKHFPGKRTALTKENQQPIDPICKPEDQPQEKEMQRFKISQPSNSNKRQRADNIASDNGNLEATSGVVFNAHGQDSKYASPPQHYFSRFVLQQLGSSQLQMLLSTICNAMTSIISSSIVSYHRAIIQEIYAGIRYSVDADTLCIDKIPDILSKWCHVTKKLEFMQHNLCEQIIKMANVILEKLRTDTTADDIYSFLERCLLFIHKIQLFSMSNLSSLSIMRNMNLLHIIHLITQDDTKLKEMEMKCTIIGKNLESKWTGCLSSVYEMVKTHEYCVVLPRTFDHNRLYIHRILDINNINKITNGKGIEFASIA
jgi:hypothetical protein